MDETETTTELETQDEPKADDLLEDLDLVYENFLAEFSEEEAVADEDEDGPEPGELSDEPPADEEVVDDDGEEPEGETLPEPEPEAKTNPELEALRAELAEMKALLRQKQEPEPKPQAPAASVAERADFETAVHIAMFGSEQDQETWNALPARIRKDAADFVKGATRAEVRYLLNPEHQFKDRFAPYVEKMIQERLAPIVQDYQQRQVSKIMEPYQERLQNPAEMTRLREIIAELPGANSTDIREQQKLLKFAMEKLDWEKRAAELESKHQKVQAAESQRKANRQARRQRGVRQTSSKATQPIPELGEHEDLVDYYQRLVSNPDLFAD